MAQSAVWAHPVFRTTRALPGVAASACAGVAATALVVIEGGQTIVAVAVAVLAVVLDAELSRRRLRGVAAVVLSGAAVSIARLAQPAAGLPLLLAAGARSRDRAALPAAFVAATFILLLATFASGNPPGTASVFGPPVVVAVNLLGLLGLRVATSVRTSARRERQMLFATGERIVVAAAHDDMASLVRALDECVAALHRAGDDAALRLAASVEDVISVCQRARRGVPFSVFPDVPSATGPSSSSLMDRWGRFEKTPNWWPTLIRELWASTAGGWLDSVRLLHTRDIERVALAGTLYLRAALVLILPGAASLTITGVVPFAEGVSPIRDAGWALGAAWALALALASPWIAVWLVDSDRVVVRRLLLGLDSLIAICAILAVPSWLSFALFAGPINWLMRPRWRLRRLAVAVVISLGLLLCALWLANRLRGPGAAVGELLAGVVALGLISNSFGLLFPVVVVHLLLVLPSWKLRAARFRSDEWQARTRQVRDALDDALRIATAERERSPAVAQAELQVRRARVRVEQLATPSLRKPLLHRRRSLGEIVQAGLGRAARDPVHPLRCAVPAFEPAELQDWSCRSWRVANHLEVALARIAGEAVRHGEFEIRSRFRLTADASWVEVLVENDLPVDHESHETQPGRGAREVSAAIRDVPGGALLRRDAMDSTLGIPIFAVEFTFAASALAASGGR